MAKPQFWGAVTQVEEPAHETLSSLHNWRFSSQKSSRFILFLHEQAHEATLDAKPTACPGRASTSVNGLIQIGQATTYIATNYALQYDDVGGFLLRPQPLSRWGFHTWSSEWHARGERKIILAFDFKTSRGVLLDCPYIDVYRLSHFEFWEGDRGWKCSFKTHDNNPLRASLGGTPSTSTPHNMEARHSYQPSMIAQTWAAHRRFHCIP